MAVIIAGLKQPEALRQLGVSRMTLHRYRKSPDWPGDDADLAIIRAYVDAKKGIAGRRAKSPPRPTHPPSLPAVASANTGPTPSDDPADEWQEYQDAMSLDEEMKRTMIEKNKVAIRDYQLKCMEVYRKTTVAAINKALDILFDEIDAAGLTSAQVDNIRQSIRRAQITVAGGKANPAQPELF